MLKTLVIDFSYTLTELTHKALLVSTNAQDFKKNI